MMRLFRNACVLFLAVIALSTVTYASAGGLSEISCQKLHYSLGGYKVKVTETNVYIIDFKDRNNESVEHIFSLNDCKFKPFSIDLTCEQEDGPARLRIEVKKRRDRFNRRYHTVDFKFRDIDLADYSFDTFQVEPLSKRHRCQVNGMFEVL